MKKNAINYWKELEKMGVSYGTDVVLAHEIIGGRFVRVLEFRGRNFKTAKEIYEFLSR